MTTRRYANVFTGLCALLGIILLGCEIASAQDYRAKLQGVVTDSTHAVVAGARVALHNDNTGVETVKTSNESGYYVFDFVEPGTYTVFVEQAGFSKFVQQNVLVQVRGDVTVNPVLNVGAVAETINVTANTAAIQLNTSTMELTVDRKMLTDLPILARNPFTLALLNPAVVNRYFATRNPFFMWSSSSIDVGGSTSRMNDILLDGAPIQIGQKGSYSPPMDAVQEFSVQQNSVDAEFGHSAGGTLSLGMKSGTNEFHGSAYYFGRNPKLNAVTNPITRTPNLIRNHIWGGSLGNAVRKNKLFMFTAYEGWRTKEPRTALYTLPTDLERQGDFSQSRNVFGGLRTVYDPFSTTFDPATGRVNRAPFDGNRIPLSRMDPTSLRILKDVWKPNGSGIDITGQNNYQVGYSWPMKYWNFSERVDWNISDKLKVFGRFSRVRTDLESDNFANSPAVQNDNGGIMNNRNIAGDVVYVLRPSTVLNARFSYASLEDDYDGKDRKIGEQGLSQFWPNNPWYKPYIGQMPAVYYPSISVGNNTGFGKGSYWFQHPHHYSYSAHIRQTRGIHSWKTGFEGRLHHSDGIFPNLMGFPFGPALTSDTFISPDLRRSGHEWASFLLGALDSNSYAQTWPFQNLGTKYWAGFIHDDVKLTQRITLNLGLRYEYEGPMYEFLSPLKDRDRLSRFLDLSQPIPEMQQAPPQIPASVLALRNTPLTFNGAWVFTDKSHRGAYDVNPHVFTPRAGVAIRITDKTAFRAGFARYVIPSLSSLNFTTLSRIPMPYFSSQTNAAPVLEGVPQARLSDPFPSSNPLILPVGKSLGRYTNLGDTADWVTPDLRTGVNDRINFTLQRELPRQIHGEVTYFMNLGHDLPYGRRPNIMDPQLSYTNKAELDRRIPNPFFEYLTPDKFPGALRNQRTVTVGSLLVPYPQYGSLRENNVAARLNRYYALQARLQKAFSGGYTLLWAYNYNHEWNSEFFNIDDEFLGRFTMLPSDNQRHRMSVAGTYDFPFGKGRKYVSNMHPVVNGILGGWSTSGLLLFRSGQYLRFGQMITDGSNPAIGNRTRDHWFDTSKFQKAEPFTKRTNPWQYPGLTGPKYWNLDATISKFFPIRERFRLEFKFEAYNLPNVFVPSMPITNVLSPSFGRAGVLGTGQEQENRGREMQYSLRLHF